MRLELSARKLDLPDRCACCLRVPDGKFAATATRDDEKSKTWELPYCQPCLGHVELWTKNALAIPFAVVGVAAIASLPLALWAGPVVLALGGAAVVWHWIHRRAAARNLMRPGCSSAGPAARYLGWRGTVHTFELANERFGLELAGKNREKLVTPLPQLDAKLDEHRARDDEAGIAGWLRRRLGTLVSAADVATHRGKPTLARAEAVELADELEPRGLGLEPDPRAARTAPTSFVPFATPVPWQQTPAWRSATLIVRLAQVVTALDDAREREHLTKRLGALLPVDVDRARLAAHIVWVGEAKPKATLFKKKLGELPEPARVELGKLLVELAEVDGAIAPDEDAALDRAFAALNVPRPSAPPATKSELDMNLVAEKLKDTERAAAILGSIFVEDEEQADEPKGLGEKHRRLFMLLAAKPTWPRPDAARLAADEGLMLDGALEAINEHAFEAAGRAAFEGDDPIEVTMKELP